MKKILSSLLLSSAVVTFVLAEMPYAMDKSNELINLYSARKENPPTELIVGNLSALNVYKTAMLLLLLEY